MVEVRAGIMKTKVPLSGLRAPDKMGKKRPNSASRCVPIPPCSWTMTGKASMELNLLGYTVEEALAETDKFIDGAVLRGQNTVYIIHGKGTGALRTAIQKHLRTPQKRQELPPGPLR